MAEEIEILILDDHAIIRKGIRLTIETSFGIKSIAEVSTCNGLLAYVKDHVVTHMVLDLLVSDGNTMEIIPVIRKLYPDIRILVFTMQPTAIYSFALKQYGIWEYLHKEASEETTIAVLEHFFFGSSEPVKEYEKDVLNPFSRLSARELEVLHYLLKGTGTKEIAVKLGLHMSSVSTFKGRIFEKTSTSNLKELIDIALAFNITT